jgi:hypothetical protein
MYMQTTEKLEIEQRYNAYIAQKLGVSLVPDYMNDPAATAAANTKIKSMGLWEQYQDALYEMQKGKREPLYKTKRSDFRTFAIIKMFRKIDGI